MLVGTMQNGVSLHNRCRCLDNAHVSIQVLSDVSFLHRETLSGQLLSLGYPQKVLELFKVRTGLHKSDTAVCASVLIIQHVALGGTTVINTGAPL